MGVGQKTNQQQLIDEILASYRENVCEGMSEDSLIEEVLTDSWKPPTYEGSPQQRWDSENGFKIVDEKSNEEGGGEYCYTVFSWRGKYYYGEYTYYSHDGCYYDNFVYSLSEVSPKEKTVTVYE